MSEARRDVLGARLVRADLLGEVLLEGAQLRACQGTETDLPGRVLPVRRRTATLNDGVLAVDLLRDVRDLVRRVALVRAEGDLRTTLEIDAEIEASRAERNGARNQDQRGHPEPHAAVLHEVDLQPLRGLLALRAHEA